ncbi:MAG TPA: hypothetical protein DEF41_13785 [Desulfovibrio sp.]|nr:hypothetical protein [Desulfovibrio sp.]
MNHTNPRLALSSRKLKKVRKSPAVQLQLCYFLSRKNTHYVKFIVLSNLTPNHITT